MYENVFIVDHGPVSEEALRREMGHRRLENAVVLYRASSDDFFAAACGHHELIEFGPIRVEFYAKSNRERIELSDVISKLDKNERSKQGFYLLSPSSTVSFASLGRSLSSYRNIVEILYPNAAVELLVSLRDMMALKYYKPNSAEINSSSFNRHLLRKLAKTPEEIQIYLRGHQILTASEAVAIRSSKPQLRMQFTARNGYGSDVNFQFGTVDDLGARAAVLIGKNGVGKTHFLRQIATLMLTPSHDLSPYVDDGPFRASRLLCFFTGPRVSRAFPRQTPQRRVQGYKVFNLQNDTRTASIGVVNAVAELITSDEVIADLSRFEIFRNSVKSVRKVQPLYIWHEELGPIDLMLIGIRGRGADATVEYQDNRNRRHQNSAQDFAFRLDSDRGIFSYEEGDLSSGEEAYIRFCIFSSLYIENGSAVLMDEPEVYLHPQYIDALMGALHRLLELTGSVAFICTHSAYIVRCAEEQLVFLMRTPSDGHPSGADVELTQPRMRTYGADVGMISLFVFGEDEMATTEDRARAYAKRVAGGDSANEIVRALEAITSPDLISKIVKSNAPR